MAESIEEEVKLKIESDLPELTRCKNCQELCDPYTKPALHCSGVCNEHVHVQCLKRGGVPGPCIGDVFFQYTCSDCSSSREEILTRDKMSWLNIIVLTLYNLREKSNGISKRGYFHWKSDISTFVDRNWDYLFKKSVKRKKNWIGTISGTLSHYSGVFFKSGTTELNESGWWRLIDTDPPQVLIAKNGKLVLERKKQMGTLSKVVAKQRISPSPSESSISVGEDSNYGGESSRSQGLSMYSRAYVQPSETLSDFLLAEDDVHDMDVLDIDDGIELNVRREPPSLTDLMRDFQYQSYQPYQSCNNQLTLMDNFTTDWEMNVISSATILSNHNDVKDDANDDTKEEEPYEEDSSDSLSSLQEQPTISLFNVSEKRDWPWKYKNIAAGNVEKKIRMSEQEESYILQKADKRHLDSAPPAVRRLYRKLAVRKLKREHGLPVFDLDSFGCKSDFLQRNRKRNNRVLDRFVNEGLGGAYEKRLQGYNEPTAVHSPYTNRILKPFIRRDTSCRPQWLKLMEELQVKVNKKNPEWKFSKEAPIDYSYVRPQHIPAINSLCSQFFWPGIDLTECLQYPDFSCVVLYKKLVIGFAVLVPDVGYNEAYISFFVTRPEWRRVGIGTFMLYHLIQTCMGKDVTLHVSATNPALILYQKFGFKVEEFIQDFYDKYIPPNSRDCRHALFLRLSR
ncbi:cysteine-rich protein 2-binding protein isoform X1 [Neodiprion fabricii]|uniref:cysteine-rich protein 2-binding protein isoform X1 n=1 Tax=Neodiprion fabricii TaxID=2872261 RepID=UPI001ED8DD52|nr:cysteine-rich protein 2-binding protein isoform X1 [Neodiprion fabricii]